MARRRSRRWGFWDFFLAALVVVIAIITLGSIFSSTDKHEGDSTEDKTPEPDPVSEPKPKINKQKDKVPQQDSVEPKLNTVTSELSDQVNQISVRRIKNILFLGRVFVALTLVFLNLIFYFYNKSSTSLKWESHLNFNELILLAYTFVAFVLYGSLAKFTHAITAAIIRGLTKGDLVSLAELEYLQAKNKHHK
jgi:hypothetical protein